MPGSASDKTKDRKVVVACQVMEPELEWVRKGNSRVEIRYIDQGLHRTPKDMAGLVQEQIDQAEGYATQMVLAYGLCSNPDPMTASAYFWDLQLRTRRPLKKDQGPII